MIRLRRHLVTFALVLALGAVGASVADCHRPVTIVTPAGQAAYDADQVVLRLTELSNVVKDDTGYQYGNVAPADAFTIIEWVSGDDKHRDATGALAPTIGVVQIIQTTVGQGWKAAARQSWQTRIRPILERYPTLAPWVSVVEGLLEVL